MATSSALLHKIDQLANRIATLRVADEMCLVIWSPFPLHVFPTIGGEQNSTSPAAGLGVWRHIVIVAKKRAVLNIEV